MRHQVLSVVGQQGCILLLHSATPVWISEGGANGGGNRGGAWRSVNHQYQPIDGAKNAGGVTSHHCVDVV
jgi:hypothetical protein